MFETIIKNPLFKGLTIAETEALFSNELFQIKSYDNKDFVALQGDPCNHMMIMLKGTVQAQMVDHSGRLIVMAEISAPFAIAPAFLYAEQCEMPVSVVAIKESEILLIRRDVFTDLLQKNKLVLQNYLTMISNRSKFLSDKIHFLTFRTIKSKIADFLLKRAKESNSNVIILDETQQELADIFGVARPSLARTFKDMEEEGLILIERKKMTLLDPQKLKKLAL
jgi:CRP-like cAMP-binding protein